MFTPDAMDAFAQELRRRNGLSPFDAERFAALIGDTPEMTEDGRCCVRDESGNVLAVLHLPSDDPGEALFRCVESEEGWEFQVATVSRHGHEPWSEWKTFRRWKTEPDAARLARAEIGARRDRRFFVTCTLCGEMVQTGDACDPSVCQRCAQEKMGVVF
jgi:hypothetical protein